MRSENEINYDLFREGKNIRRNFRQHLESVVKAIDLGVDKIYPSTCSLLIYNDGRLLCDIGGKCTNCEEVGFECHTQKD